MWNVMWKMWKAMWNVDSVYGGDSASHGGGRPRQGDEGRMDDHHTHSSDSSKLRSWSKTVMSTAAALFMLAAMGRL